MLGVAGSSGAKRNCMAGDFTGGEYMSKGPATPEAARFVGYDRALRPGFEPIIVARKPCRGTIAATATWSFSSGWMQSPRVSLTTRACLNLGSVRKSG